MSFVWIKVRPGVSNLGCDTVLWHKLTWCFWATESNPFFF